MNRSLRFRPTLETLEHRACPVFFAGLSHGNLLITATEATNLLIEQLDPDSFHVFEGNSGTMVTIDGVTKDLRIRLSDENDFVQVVLYGQTLPGDVRVDLGDGFNSFDIGNVGGGTVGGDLRIRGGSGKDQVLLGDSSFFQELRVLGRTDIRTGGGNDEVYLGIGNPVTFSEPVQIHLGDGDDVLITSGLFLKRANAHGGCGTDVVFGSHPNLTVRGFE